MNLSDMRKEYTRAGLRRADLAADPFAQFRKWLDEALKAQVPEPTATTLATADKTGQPSARTVLLKELDARGFVFFTNYQSRKGHDLAENPHASLVFYWKELERQVCVRGTVAQVSREESAAYFKTRPVGSRIGAWASEQSKVIENRDVLEHRFLELERKYPGEDVPLPPFWGGYVLAPEAVEFWQGRASRLHDRFRYSRPPNNKNAAWAIDRLAP